MTTLRVTQALMQESFLRALRTQLSRLQTTQHQISTGERFSRPAEDPVAATQVLNLDAALAANAQYSGNAELTRNRLGAIESALSGSGDVMQRLRELAVQAANATASAESRRLIAAEVRQHLDGILQIANATDGEGEYLFSGYSVQTQPFGRDPNGNIVYNGDQGLRQIQIGPNRFVADSDPGSSIFQLIRNGNGTFATAATATNTGTGVVGTRSVVDPVLYDGDTYTVTFTSAGTYEVRDSANALVTSGGFAPGTMLSFRGIQLTVDGQPATGDSFSVAPSQNQDMFTTIENFLAALEGASDAAAARADFSNITNNFILDLDQALGRTLEVRASVGSRLSSIDAQQALNEDFDLQLKTLRSDLKDTDYAAVLTRLNQQMISLEAAQKSYVQTQGLSLFDYL
jgi:flagellar hook-associated protein 3 FlgL